MKKKVDVLKKFEHLFYLFLNQKSVILSPTMDHDDEDEPMPLVPVTKSAHKSKKRKASSSSQLGDGVTKIKVEKKNGIASLSSPSIKVKAAPQLTTTTTTTPSQHASSSVSKLMWAVYARFEEVAIDALDLKNPLKTTLSVLDDVRSDELSLVLHRVADVFTCLENMHSHIDFRERSPLTKIKSTLMRAEQTLPRPFGVYLHKLIEHASLALEMMRQEDQSRY